MNRQQVARLKRHRKVADVLAEYPTDVQTVPAFAEVAREYAERLERLSGVPARRTSKGATEHKGDLREKLEAGLLKLSNALYLLYRKQGDLEAARTMPRKSSEYSRLDELELARVAQGISKAGIAQAADLTSYNLKDTGLQELATTAQTFRDNIARPKTAIEAGKLTTATVSQLLQDLDRYLKDDFHSAAELLADTHPLLYGRLREAMRIDDPSYGRSAEAKARKAAKRAAKRAAKQNPAPDGSPTPPAA